MTTAADYDVRIDWDDDGDFDGTGEDVSTRARTDISTQYGRDQARALSPVQPGQAAVELDNRSKDYTPGNASSPLFGDLEPGRRLRMRATVGGNTYTIYRGFLDDYKLRPEVDNRYVTFTALDALARLRGSTITTELYDSIRTGEAIGHILDAIGWPAGDRDLDNGSTFMPWWWEDGADAFEALLRILHSEGPPALATVSPDGEFVFRDRHHRIVRAASINSQATFSGTGSEPLISEPLNYDLGWRNIVNTIDFEVAERRVVDEIGEVWSNEDTITIDASSARMVTVRPTDPFRDAVTPVEGTDFEVKSGSVTNVTLSRTSGQSTVITLTAGAGGATVDGLILRARPVPVARTYRVTDADTASQDAYGERTMPSGQQPVWAGREDAAAIGQVILNDRAERLPTLKLHLLSGLNDGARLEQQLGRDLSDRVTVVSDSVSLNDDFYIEQIQHQVIQGGTNHETWFGCEQVPPVLDDPDTVFRFDVAGQGFDDGTFAH